MRRWKRKSRQASQQPIHNHIASNPEDLIIWPITEMQTKKAKLTAKHNQHRSKASTFQTWFFSLTAEDKRKALPLSFPEEKTESWMMNKVSLHSPRSWIFPVANVLPPPVPSLNSRELLCSFLQPKSFSNLSFSLSPPPLTLNPPSPTLSLGCCFSVLPFPPQIFSRSFLL